MRTFLVLMSGLMLLPHSSFATGFNCHSECVVVRSDQYRVYVLPQASYRGALPRHLAYEELVQDCMRIAQEQGYGSEGRVFASLYWESSHQSESTVEAVSHVQSGVIGNSTSVYRKRGRRVWSGTSVSVVSTHQSSSRYYSKNTEESVLNVYPEMATPEVSCQEDSSIGDHEVPYTGDLPVQG